MTEGPRPALFDAHPELAARVPWMSLGRFPTPAARVEGLVPPSVELWVKRDDLSASEYGGNKVRKLEFLLAEARARGKTRLLTVGGIGSHHVVATTIYGRRAGFDVAAVVFPQPVNEHVREQLAVDLAAGATLLPTRGYAGVPFLIARERARRGTYYIPGGGSSSTGTLGYVSAGIELARQIERGELERPDVIYVAFGSGSTAAGLLVGLAEIDPPIELCAVRVVDRVIVNATKARRLARAALRRLELRAPVRKLRLRVEHDFFGGRYGRATPEAERAVAQAKAVGLELEPTYTGKTVAALLAHARAGQLDGKRVLYWHTYSSADLAPLVARAPALAEWPPLLRRLIE